MEDVFDDDQISAVHVATPAPTHYTVAKKALHAGKSVLLEKPMTFHAQECYELVGLAKSEDLVLDVGHIFRYNRALQLATQMLKTREVGKIFYVRIQWTDQDFFEDRDIIFDLGPHPVDILNQLLGTWPTEVSGVGRAYRNSKTANEVAYIFGEFPNDIFAHIELSWLHPTKVREVSIVGSEGSLIIDCLTQKIAKHVLDIDYNIPVTPNNTIATEIEHFIDRIERADTTISLTGPKTVEILEAVQASLWQKKTPTITSLIQPEQMVNAEGKTKVTDL